MAVELYGYKETEVARILNMHISNVSRAIRKGKKLFFRDRERERDRDRKYYFKS